MNIFYKKDKIMNSIQVPSSYYPLVTRKYSISENSEMTQQVVAVSYLHTTTPVYSICMFIQNSDVDKIIYHKIFIVTLI